MKKLSLFIAFIICVLSLNAQTPFKVEKIDTVNKTKDKIYSDTKMFIAEYWKSAQNVIQNDDKEAGLVLVKGTLFIDKKVTFAISYTYTYSYTVKFFMKEQKFRILIEDVICTNASNDVDNRKPNLIQLNEPHKFNLNCNLSEKKTEEVKETVKKRINDLAEAYSIYIKKLSAENDNW